MKSVVITGASSGIGRATALRMDAGGWRVFAGVRREEDAEALRAAASERLVPLTLDVTAEEQIAAAAERIGGEVGESGLDGLVNNAGINLAGPLETISLDDLRRQIAVNLTAQVAVTQPLLPHLRRDQGRIVFVSSIGGRMALPFNGPYHAAKFGLEAVADSLRQELRPWRMPVVVVQPGAIDTPMWERGVQSIDERAPAEQGTLYGERIARAQKVAMKAASHGIAPDKVARTIERALTARRPRTRYLVGLDARGQAVLRSLLPDRAFDSVVSRFSGV